MKIIPNKMKKNLLILLCLICCFPLSAQHIGLSFKEASEKGIVIEELDSLYTSAVHADTAKAVFKTAPEMELMREEYQKLLQALGDFLLKNNFEWEKPTRCFNRIYFKEDGSIDYFLFNFTGKEADKPSAERQAEFQRLLNLFIQDYKISLTAKTKFAQCSPTMYMPKG